MHRQWKSASGPIQPAHFYQMHITRIRLENIKSYTQADFSFARGTIAITGPNGAGKTTIIEAVAWTLFNVLDYKKEDFVRRGARKGKAEVTFVSSLDEREYTVVRDTGSTYFVIDTQLGVRVADKTAEVGRFLQKHLGVEPGTDLESLFRQAIGVPQGTLTAIFLAAPTERKRTFDALLKVDEYRRGADELLKTVRYLERAENENETAIARAEGEIAAAEGLPIELEQIGREIEQLQASISSADREIDRLRSEVSALEAIEAEYRRLAGEVEALSGEATRARLIASQCEKELSESLVAETALKTNEAGAERHKQALKKLAELERERSALEKLRVEIARIDTALTAVKADLRHFDEDLQESHRASVQLAEISNLVIKQAELEKHLSDLRSALAGAKVRLESAEAIRKKLAALREEYRSVSEQLQAAEKSAAAGAELETLRTREGEIIRSLASLTAELEHRERLQAEIKNGLCPILSEKCLNLKPGQTLEGFIATRFDTLRAEIKALSGEQAKIEAQRAHAEQAEKASHLITPLRERLSRIEHDGKALADELSELSKTSDEVVALESEIAAILKELEELADPRAVASALESQIRREPEIREKISIAEKNLEKLEAERLEILEQMELYAGFEERLAEAIKEKDETEDAYKQYLANEKAARLAADRRSKLSAAREALEAAEVAYRNAAERLAEAEKKFNKDLLDKLRSDFLEIQKKRSADAARLEFMERRAAEISERLAKISQIREDLKGRYGERERLSKIKATTEFIRETLRDAAPLVARNYVFHVSAEANNLFREITGAAERTLKWTEDYSIIVEEDGFIRPFALLSGGEQMAAALSVRLALLKQLSGIRIAFFDEPTTNLDADRRENLAMQIGAIRHFDQLFVISHDDTFEGYFDHEIRIG